MVLDVFVEVGLAENVQLVVVGFEQPFVGFVDVGVFLESGAELLGVVLYFVVLVNDVKEFGLYVDKMVEQSYEFLARVLVVEVGCEVGIVHHLFVAGDKPFGCVLA